MEDEFAAAGRRVNILCDALEPYLSLLKQVNDIDEVFERAA